MIKNSIQKVIIVACAFGAICLALPARAVKEASTPAPKTLARDDKKQSRSDTDSARTQQSARTTVTPTVTSKPAPTPINYTYKYYVYSEDQLWQRTRDGENRDANWDSPEEFDALTQEVTIKINIYPAPITHAIYKLKIIPKPGDPSQPIKPYDSSQLGKPYNPSSPNCSAKDFTYKVTVRNDTNSYTTGDLCCYRLTPPERFASALNVFTPKYLLPLAGDPSENPSSPYHPYIFIFATQDPPVPDPADLTNKNQIVKITFATLSSYIESPSNAEQPNASGSYGPQYRIRMGAAFSPSTGYSADWNTGKMVQVIKGCNLGPVLPK